MAEILKYKEEGLSQHVRYGVFWTRQNQGFHESLPEVRYLFSFKNETQKTGPGLKSMKTMILN